MACVGDIRKLDARFLANGCREFAGANASAHTAQLQSIRVELSVISYRRWGFRVVDDTSAFLKSVPAESEICAKLPYAY